MSYLIQNLGKRKIALFVISFLLFIAAIVYIVIKSTPSDTATPVDISGYSNAAGEAPKGLESMVKVSLADIIKKNNPNKAGLDSIAPKVRDNSYTATPPNSDGIIQAKFFVDIESLKQSYLVYISYYKDTPDKFAGPPSVRCIENKDDLIYGDFDCQEISPVDDTLSKDALLSKLPHKDPLYYISGYVDSEGHKHVVVDIDLNTYSEATRKMFQERKEQSLQWIKSQDVDSDEYLIEWRNLRRTVIERNNVNSVHTH